MLASRRTLGVLITLAVLAGSMPTATAANAWAVSGSFKLSPESGCSSSPTCQGFLAVSQRGEGCDPELVRPEGLDASIAGIPDVAAGARARLAWASSGGALTAITVGFIGEIDGRCLDLGAQTLPAYPQTFAYGYGSFVVEMHQRASYVYVNAARAVDVTWWLYPTS